MRQKASLRLKVRGTIFIGADCAPYGTLFLQTKVMLKGLRNSSKKDAKIFTSGGHRFSFFRRGVILSVKMRILL
jgi:hypothetical protein